MGIKQIKVNNVDIYCYPKSFSDSQGSLTIGDLHGNAVKFLYFLLCHKIVEFTGENKESLYNKFVNCHEKSRNHDLSKEELQTLFNEFNNLIAQMKVINSDVLIRLVGDEVADRGGNDYFTLKLLELLNNNNVKVNITISNHSNAFIQGYEDDTKEFKSEHIKAEQTPSLTGLKKLTQNDIITYDDVMSLINKIYKPSLKVLDYEHDDNSITLITHAPVEFAIIRLLADKFGVAYKDASSKELASTIDAINAKFSECVEKNEVSASHLKYEKNKLINELSSAEFPVMHITWNRFDKIKDQPDNARPEKMHDGAYSVKYVHGHDVNYQSSHKHVTNLDTYCGKAPQSEDFQRNTQYIALEMNAGIEKDVTVFLGEKIIESAPAPKQRRSSRKPVESDTLTAVEASERLRRFITIFATGGAILGASIGIGLAASGLLAGLGSGFLLALAVSTIIGCALGSVGGVSGLIIAKMSQPAVANDTLGYSPVPSNLKGSSKALAGLGGRVTNPSKSHDVVPANTSSSKQAHRVKPGASVASNNELEAPSALSPH